MKRTKSMLSLLLTLALFLSCLSLTAYATTDDADTPEEPPLSEATETDTPVEVASLEELLAAIAAAEDGDTIYIAKTIRIDGDELTTDKNITLRSAEGMTDTLMLVSPQGGKINGFHFIDTDKNRNTITIAAGATTDGVLEIKSCIFDGESVHGWYFLNNFGYISIHIYDCSFTNNNAVAVSLNGSNDIIDGCTFKNNITIFSGAAFTSSGTLHISNSIVTGNSSGIYNTGYLAIENCEIYGNTLDIESGGDIRNDRTLSIDAIDGKSLYSVETGTKIELPINEYSEMGYFVILSDEEAADFFASTDDLTPDTPPVDTPETPTEPTTPPVDTPEAPDTPETPTEPKEPDTPEAPTEPQPPTEPEVPEEPTEPEETPDEPDVDPAPAPIRPTYPVRPIRPYVPPVEQETEQEDTPEETPPLYLSHGGATLDTSTPLVLLGYGDGQLHENDPITRAQIAVLLFRSLTDESKAHLSNSENPFADVAAEAWYFDGVSTLSAAGIINGYNGRFSPNDHLTWGQLIALLTRFVEAQTADVPEDITYTAHWAYNNIVTAVAYGWIDNAASIDPDRPVTRGEAVEFVNSIFESCEATDTNQ